MNKETEEVVFKNKGHSTLYFVTFTWHKGEEFCGTNVNLDVKEAFAFSILHFCNKNKVKDGV